MASVRKAPWTYKGVTKWAWVCEYTDPETGKRPRKTFKSKKAADAFKLKIESEIEAGQHLALARSATVESICDDYLRYCETRRRDGRIGGARLKSLREAVNTAILPYLGKVMFSELSATQVENLYSKLIDARGITPGTAKARIKEFARIERFAIKRGLAKKEVVAEALKELAGVGSSDKVRTFSMSDAQHLFSIARSRREKGRLRSVALLNCAIHLAAFCGLRYGEIAGLTVSAIDFDEQVIRVRQSLSDVDGIKSPKTRAGVRDVPMPAHVAALLRDWLHSFLNYREDGLVFTVRQNHGGWAPLKATAFHQNYWRPLMRRAGLADSSGRPLFHFHALRHFCASWWITNGVPITDAAQMLGHAKYDVTLQVYAHPMSGQKQRHALVSRLAHEAVAAPMILDATREREDYLTR